MKRKKEINLVRCAVAFALLAVVGKGLPAEERSSTANIELIDEFSVSDELLVLPVTLDGKTYSFCLDTGCTRSIFDAPLAKYLGRPVGRTKVTTLGQAFSAPEYNFPNLKVGRSLPPRDALVHCLSLRDVQQAADQPLDGLLGMDFLRAHVVQLNFDDGKLRFLKTVPPDSGDRFAIVVGTAQQIDIPQLNVAINGGDSLFSIDTGYGGTISVTSQLFADMDEAGRIGLRSTGRVATAGGTVGRLSGRLDSLSVGRFTHRNLVLDGQSGWNVIGTNYLNRFIVTFDFPRQTMYLKPGRKFNRVDDWDLSGLHIWRVNGDAVIETVDPGSPAETTGLKPKDVVTHIDGQPAAAVSLSSLRRVLRKSERTVALAVRRGEQTIRVELKTKEFRTTASAADEPAPSDAER